MTILGISCFYHDSAAALVKDGEIVSAAQEERFTRKKHDAGFPKQAISYCLKAGEITIAELNFICFYDKPFLKFERLVETYLAYAPKGIRSFLISMPSWIKEKLWMREILQKNMPGFKGKFLFTRHHESHAASAFFPSPFQESAILTLDGVGEWATTSISMGRDNNIRLISEIKFPHSLGLLYAALTYYLGFKINSGEYKVMGLAPYGKPIYKDLFYKNLIHVKKDGSFRLNMKYFDYCSGLTMTNARFHKLFGSKPRLPESDLTQREMDIAASLQVITEEIILKIGRHIKTTLNQKNLCLAGGVALNCVANGKLLRSGLFENLWIQPAAGDAGGALGAALFVWYQYLGNKRTVVMGTDSQKGSLLGPDFSNDEIKTFLGKNKIPYKEYPDQALVDITADLLSQEKVVGWFQGKMEFGPRALGARSILGDARSANMQSVMNLKIKFRESFRPFAPVVLEEMASEYFEIDRPSPYMLLVADVQKNKRMAAAGDSPNLFGIEKLKLARSVIPAVTHIDYSARIQTINRKDNPIYYDLVKEFYKKTGCPVLVNTSFNVRGEPIVCTFNEAYVCFMRTNIDYLVLGNFILNKEGQPPFADAKDWKKEFALD